MAAIFSITLPFLGRTAAANPFAYIGDSRDGENRQLWIVDLATNKIVNSIPLRKSWGVDDILSTPGGRFVYVLRNSLDLSPLDTRSNTFVDKVHVGLTNGTAITPDGRFVYLASTWYEGWPQHHVVTVLETATDSFTEIPVDDEPYAIAVTPDGRRVYVPACKDYCGHLSGGEVYVLDASTQQVAATIGGVGPGKIALSPDGAFAYVTSIVDYPCALRSSCASLAIIDTTTNAVTSTVSLPAPGFPEGIAVTPDGRFVYVTLAWTLSYTWLSSVAVVDTATATLAATIRLPDGSDPDGIAITPDGRFAYVVNRATQSLAVIDTGTNAISDTIPLCDGVADCWPTRIAIASVPTSTVQCEPNTVCLAVGSTTVAPGATQTVAVTLSTAGYDVAATQNDLTFSAAAAIAATPEGRPDCQPNAQLGVSLSAFGFIPSTCTPGVDCTKVRALVLPFEHVGPIPDGSLLYACNVKTADDLAAGIYPLYISNVGAADPSAGRVKAVGADGEIVVTSPSNLKVGQANAGALPGTAGGCQTSSGGNHYRPWALLLPVLALLARRQRNQSSRA